MSENYILFEKEKIAFLNLATKLGVKVKIDVLEYRRPLTREERNKLDTIKNMIEKKTKSLNLLIQERKSYMKENREKPSYIQQLRKEQIYYNEMSRICKSKGNLREYNIYQLKIKENIKLLNIVERNDLQVLILNFSKIIRNVKQELRKLNQKKKTQENIVNNFIPEGSIKCQA